MLPRRILICTATGVHNVGDEVILRAEFDVLRSRYPDAEIRIATYDARSHFVPSGDSKIAFFSYFPNAFRRRPFSNVGYFIRNAWEICRADWVVIGGGGLFYDNEGQNFRKQAFEWALRTRIARFFGKPVFFWGIGVDVREENLPALESIFRGASAVMVRDTRSADSLGRIGISVQTAPDPAFLFDLPRTCADLKAPVPFEKPKSPVVGISVRPGYLPRGLEDVRAIVQSVRAEGFEPRFVHHSFHPNDAATDDAAHLAPLASEMNVRFTSSMSETLAAYGICSFIVSMRLHSGLLAAVSGVPPLVLSYSAKTAAFADRLECERMEARSFNPEAFRKAFRHLVASREAQIFAMGRKCAIIKEQARISFGATLHGLERDKK